ncbi:MAG: AraC family transcriptional regulator [Bacteroidia bacterium]|nr:AraC family transcriptional regulator [Bacteroidia bacterium]
MILDYQKIEILQKTVFERVRFKPPLKATEIMENEACLIYALNGSSNLFGGSYTASLYTDESVLMKCGNFINSWKVTENPDPYEAIAIHFYPDVIQLVFENNIPDYLQNQASKDHKVFQKIAKNDILKSYITSLLMYFENPALFNTDVIKLKMRELIALLYQLDSHGIRDMLSDLFNPHQLEFKQVIAAHIFHDLSLEEYASLLHLSLSSFKRKFKEIYGNSPGQYIQNKRLEKAAQLLSTSTSRISDICYDCGFGDISNFSKAFSKKYGISPSEYQKDRLN